MSNSCVTSLVLLVSASKPLSKFFLITFMFVFFKV